MVKKLLLLALAISLSGCTTGGFPAAGVPSSPAPVGKDCTYNLETDSLITVDILPEKEALYKDKEETVWALVKRDAPIPAWKVWSGYGGGEMEEIGTTTPDADPDNPDGFGKRVFIGLGHCQGEPGETCLDPLPQTTLFVVQREGASSPPFPRGDPTAPGYWWYFSAYFDLGQLPPNPTNDDLPCWIRQCIGGDVREKGCRENVSSQGVLEDSEDLPPVFVNKANIIKIDTPLHWDEVEDFYRFQHSINFAPDQNWAEKIGALSAKLGDTPTEFDVWYTLDEGLLLLDPKNEEGEYYQYEPLEQLLKPRGKSLQLGTFNPVRKFIYEWWTPSCKPVIYLYPERQVSLSVFLKPFGVITKSDPFYSWLFGWRNILAFPSGKLIYRGKEYSSLYYEGRIINVKVPSAGWVVKKESLSKFFDDILPKLGLNQKEAFEFKDYWLKRLKENLYFVTFLPKEEIERIEPMEISIKPDTTIRVRLFFRAINKPIGVPRPTFPEVPKRKGFTVVEWGGFYKE